MASCRCQTLNEPSWALEDCPNRSRKNALQGITIKHLGLAKENHFQNPRKSRQAQIIQLPEIQKRQFIKTGLVPEGGVGSVGTEIGSLPPSFMSDSKCMAS